jgi:hypothetical protein
MFSLGGFVGSIASGFMSVSSTVSGMTSLGFAKFTLASAAINGVFGAVFASGETLFDPQWTWQQLGLNALLGGGIGAALGALGPLGMRFVPLGVSLMGIGASAATYSISDALFKGKIGLAFYRTATLGFAIYANSVLAKSFFTPQNYFRPMKVDDNGYPLVGTGNAQEGPTLHPRIKGTHIDVIADMNGNVLPYDQGLSVSPNTPSTLGKSLLPQSWGGTAKNERVMFRIVYSENFQHGTSQNPLPDGLTIVPQPEGSTTHSVIAPSRVMPIQAYLNLVVSTLQSWEAVPPPNP